MKYNRIGGFPVKLRIARRRVKYIHEQSWISITLPSNLDPPTNWLKPNAYVDPPIWGTLDLNDPRDDKRGLRLEAVMISFLP